MLDRLEDPRLRPVWRALLALMVLTITALALSPKPLEGLSTGWDKSNHLLAFASLAWVGVQAYWHQPRQWHRLLLVLLAYGIGIEVAQHFLPPRSADLQDVLADMLGALLGIAAAALTRRLAPSR